MQSVIPTATAAPIMGPASVTWDSAMQDILTLLHHRLVLVGLFFLGLCGVTCIYGYAIVYFE